jgi:hypothetical protein
MFVYEIDYSYAPAGNLGDTHRITVTLDFGGAEGGSSKRGKSTGIRTSPTIRK